MMTKTIAYPSHTHTRYSAFKGRPTTKVLSSPKQGFFHQNKVFIQLNYSPPPTSTTHDTIFKKYIYKETGTLIVADKLCATYIT